MPRLREDTKKFNRAKFLKVLEQENFDRQKTAKRLHMTPQNVSRTINSPEMKSIMSKILTRVGVTDKHLAITIRKGLKAKQTKFFAHEGVVTDQATTIDWNARHNYLETALKLKGHLSDAPVPAGDMHVHFSKIDINTTIGERIQNLANQLSQNSGR